MNCQELFKILNNSDYTLSHYSHELELDLSAVKDGGVKEILDLFDDLEKLMKPKIDNPYMTLLNKQSILGLYVRRAIVMFQKLNFHRVVTLFEEFKSYVNDGLDITHSINMTLDEDDLCHK